MSAVSRQLSVVSSQLPVGFKLKKPTAGTETITTLPLTADR
ncbi:hypothetical protein [Microcoleus sp. FACHB-672]|nr:hypothetical protein [Microcoleus sp. FACHB-672]